MQEKINWKNYIQLFDFVISNIWLKVKGLCSLEIKGGR